MDTGSENARMKIDMDNIVRFKMTFGTYYVSDIYEFDRKGGWITLRWSCRRDINVNGMYCTFRLDDEVWRRFSSILTESGFFDWEYRDYT